MRPRILDRLHMARSLIGTFCTLIAVACGSDGRQGSGTSDTSADTSHHQDGFGPGGGVPQFDGFGALDVPSSPDTGNGLDVVDVSDGDTSSDQGGSTDVASGCIPQGAPCNDGDLCTFNDMCQPNGTCQGTALECDDEAPCTTDKCVGGSCTAGVKEGFCFIEGICWSDAQPNPDNPTCQRCVPSSSVGTWTTQLAIACNDGNACTINDFCTETGCTGKPLDCADDNTCTSDSCEPQSGCVFLPIEGGCATPQDGPCVESLCEGGQCVTHAASDGFACDDGNACTGPDTCIGGTCTPGPLTDADGDDYPSAACQGTDCHDGNPSIHPGASELCGDGLDNDCDGATDSADSDCCGGTACTYHTDCYPEKVCAEWKGGCGLRCSVPCAGPLDCPSGEICVHMPGSAGFGYCRPSQYPQGLSNGASCAGSKDCRSEICVGVCADYCGRESACPNGTCSPAGSLQGTFFGICASGVGIGTIQLGAACSNSNTCVSGHCDLLASFKTCSPLCKSDADCLVSQECNIAMPAGGNPPGTVNGKLPANSVPFDPAYPNKTFDMGLACFARQYPNATGVTGTPCTQPSQCRSNKCFGLDPAQPSSNWCTTYCSSDADCPPTMACKLDVVTITSYWLATYGGANPNVGTFVHICKWK